MRFSLHWNPALCFRSLLVFCCMASLIFAAEQHKNIKTRKNDLKPFSSASVEKFPAQVKQVNEPSSLSPLGTLSLDLSSIAMFGIMGLPILGAINLMVPFMSGGARTTYKHKTSSRKKQLSNTNSRSPRKRRDLAYAKDLLDLLISVEKALERYNITAPQCQLRATCEIHRRGINDINSKFAENFIRLVRRMRDEIQNPRVVPLAKYVFEYYEEAAIRGETNCDCKQLYNRCRHSIDYFMKRRKGYRRLWYYEQKPIAF